MTKLDEHPSVVRFRQSEPRPHPGALDVQWLRALALEAGADDVGFVAIDRPEVDDQRRDPDQLSLDEIDGLDRLPDEPGADPFPGALSRQPRVPRHGRARQ